MLEDQETTARRFSHELHDELGQSLTAVKANLSALRSAQQNGVASRSRAPRRLPASGGRIHRQRAPDVATAAPHDSGRLRPGSRAALALGGLHASHRHPNGISNPAFPAACPTKPRRTCSAWRRRRSPMWRATPARTTAHRDPGFPRRRSLPVHSRRRPRLTRRWRWHARGMGMIGMRARARSVGGDLSVRSSAGRGRRD